jgi:hypothetical protein
MSLGSPFLYRDFLSRCLLNFKVLSSTPRAFVFFSHLFSTTAMAEHRYKTTSNFGFHKQDVALANEAMDSNEDVEQYIESTDIGTQIKALEARKLLRDKGDGTHELVACRMFVDFLYKIGEGIKKFGDERKAVIDRQTGKSRNDGLSTLRMNYVRVICQKLYTCYTLVKKSHNYSLLLQRLNE